MKTKKIQSTRWSIELIENQIHKIRVSLRESSDHIDTPIQWASERSYTWN